MFNINLRTSTTSRDSNAAIMPPYGKPVSLLFFVVLSTRSLYHLMHLDVHITAPRRFCLTGLAARSRHVCTTAPRPARLYAGFIVAI